MAGQGWTAQIGTAVGTAAAVGAAQLGLGYGLGVVVWHESAADNAVWITSLSWAAWIPATSTILGAIAGGRTRRTATQQRPAMAVPGFALAAAAAVGALVTVALIAVPARAAVRPDTFTPQSIAAGYAIVGVLIGLVVGSWAARSVPVAVNVLATSVWVWVLAVIAVSANLLGSHGGAAQLGVWQPFGRGWFIGNLAWPGAVIVVLGAIIIGFAVSRSALRRGEGDFAATVAGAVGPATVALVYLILAPTLTGVRSAQVSAYLVAPYAVLAGLGGSVLAVTAGRKGRGYRPTAPVRIPTGSPQSKRAESPTAEAPVVDVPKPRASTVTAPPEKPTVAAFPDPPSARSAKAAAGKPPPAATKAGGPRTGEPKAGEPKADEPKAGESRGAEPKAVPVKAATPRPVNRPPVAPKPEPHVVTAVTPAIPAMIPTGTADGAGSQTRGRGRRAAAGGKVAPASDMSSDNGSGTSNVPPKEAGTGDGVARPLWVDDDEPQKQVEAARRNPFRKLGRKPDA